MLVGVDDERIDLCSYNEQVDECHDTTPTLAETPLQEPQSHRKLYATDDYASKARRIGQAHIDDAKHADFARKTWRWIEDGQGGFRQAYQLGQEGDLLTLQPLNGESCTARLEDTWPVNPPKFERSEDIAELTYLNEPAVIHNLAERYEQAQIYTYSGLFLVAINPYAVIEGLYSSSAIESYRSRRRDENTPHVFAVAQAAWEALVTERESQAILVTGESGAGKTVNTKMVIRYLTAIAAGASSVLPASGSDAALSDHSKTLNFTAGGANSALERQILEANPVLEAFGNAMTVRNDNSSRFGKFVRIDFSSNGAIAGAATQTYLLEKSRVVTRNVKERSFHIFYQLLAGANAETRSRLLLASSKPADYRFLRESALTIKGVDDRAEYAATMNALAIIGLGSDEQFDLLRTISIILHLGQLAVEGSSQAHIATNEALSNICQLLGLAEVDLKRALASPRLKAGAGAGKEVVQQSRSPEQVLDEVGALSKALYERTFGSLVAKVNRALDRPAGAQAAGHFIGVLDIAGFEIFERNSFEQLLINHTNERLQQLFNSHFFQQEQELYVREGLAWDAVDYGLNLQPTIDVIEGSEPLGILAALDDESIMPRGSDEAFSRKLGERFGGSKQAPATSDIFTSNRVQNEGFTVRHYAGSVAYSTAGWINKNRDPLNADLMAVLAKSRVPCIAEMFTDGIEEAAASTNVRRGVRKGAFRTVGQRHKEDLNLLMAELGRTQPHFVRCIVPNSQKLPRQIDTPLVLHQLRCNGVIEGLRIARQGYPNRLPFIEFRNRYEVLAPDVVPKDYVDDRQACRGMIEALNVPRDQYGIGRTKVFFKAGVLAGLEGQRDAVLFDIFNRFQAACRRRIVQRAFLKHRNKELAVQIIQRNARVYSTLQAWPWWRLFTAVRPLLAAARADDTLRKRDLENALARERATRDAQEKQRLEQIEAERRASEKVLADQLEAERALIADKDAQAQRLARTLALVEHQLREADEQIQRMTDAEAKTQEEQARWVESEQTLRRELEQQHHTTDHLELVSAAWEEERAQFIVKADEHSATATNLARERDGLQRQIVELQQRIEQRNADIERLKTRFDVLIAEAESKDATALAAIQTERTRHATLEKASEAAQIRIIALENSLAEHGRHLSAKDTELHDSVKKQQSISRDLEAKSNLVNDLRAEKGRLEKDVAAAKASEQRESANAQQARTDLAVLRDTLDAKSSEETKRSQVTQTLEGEVTRLRKEIAAMRKERTEAERGQAIELTRLTQQNEKLGEERDQVKRELLDAVTKSKAVAEILEQARQSSSHAVSLRAKAEADLSSARQRARDAEEQIEQLQMERDTAQQTLKSAGLHRQELEDALVAVDQERATSDLQNQQLAQAVETAYAEVTRLEGMMRQNTEEQRALRTQIAEAERVRGTLAKQVADRDAELAKAISLQDHKVIEHVHVLEKAKRFTDAQLAETQAALAESQAREKQLDKTKTRLAGELEDLARAQRGQEGADNTAVAQVRRLEEAAAKAKQNVESERASRAKTDAVVEQLRADLIRAQSEVGNHRRRAEQAEQHSQSLKAELDRLASTSPSPALSSWATSSALDKLSQDTRSLHQDIQKSLSRTGRPISIHTMQNLGSSPSAATAQLRALDSTARQASEDVRRHIDRSWVEMQSVMTDSRLSSDAKQKRLQADNDRLRKLVEAEVRARMEAEEARLGLSGVVADQQGNINGALDSRFDRLEKARHAAEAKQRVLETELETWKRNAASGEAERRALAEQLGTLQRNLDREAKRRGEVESKYRQADDQLKTLALNSAGSADDLRRLRESQVDLDRLRKELKVAEAAKLASFQDLTLAKVQMAEKESLLSETRADLAASARGAHGRVPRNTGEEGLQRRLHDLEKTNHQLLDDLAAASRHHQSLDADFNDKIAALQRLEQTTGELDIQLERNARLQEDIARQRDALDDVRRKYDDDMHFVTEWHNEQEKLTQRVSFLSTSFDDAVARQAESQARSIDLTAEVRELKLTIDSMAAEKRALAEGKRQAEVRLKEICDEFIHTSNDVISSSGAASALKSERDALRSEAKSLEDKIQIEQERRRQAEQKINEIHESLLRERRDASALNQGNADLQRLVQSLKLQITDLETRTMTLPRGLTSRGADARIAALEAELEAERSRALGPASHETQALQGRLAAATQEKKRIAESAAQLEAQLHTSKSQVSVLEAQCSRLEMAVRQAETAKNGEKELRLRAESEVDKSYRRLDQFQRDRASPSPTPYDRGARTPDMHSPRPVRSSATTPVLRRP